MLMNPVYTEEDLKVVPSHRPVDTARPCDRRGHRARKRPHSTARGAYRPPLRVPRGGSCLTAAPAPLCGRVRRFRRGADSRSVIADPLRLQMRDKVAFNLVSAARYFFDKVRTSVICTAWNTDAWL